MTYEYELSKENVKKFGFTHLICNGWFGYYNETFNKKWNESEKKYIVKNLTDNDIDDIVATATKYEEM